MCDYDEMTAGQAAMEASEKYIKCDECCFSYPERDLVATFLNEHVCDTCLEDNYASCDYCDDRGGKPHVLCAGDEDLDVCTKCHPIRGDV